MEKLNHNSSKRRVVEEDANISTFRRRNNIIILVFAFLIISLSLIIAAFIAERVRIHNTSHKPNALISPIQAFCSVSNSPTCLTTLYPFINKRIILDPNQIFSLSLQTAANDLENIASSILSDSNSTEFEFKNCSDSLRRAVGRLGGPLAIIRVNPFVESLSEEQRGGMMKRIVAAEEDVTSCLDDLAKVNESSAAAAVGVAAAKLLDVKVYLGGAGDFLIGYAKALNVHTSLNIYVVDWGFMFGNLFDTWMRGLQLLFMLGLFCSLYRIR